jgi:hypothetical protein
VPSSCNKDKCTRAVLAKRKQFTSLAPSTRVEAAAASARHSVVEETIEAVWSEATRKID